MQVMSHIIEGVGCNDFQRLQMQQNITTFEDILGGCERLLRTPIPVSYTRHTSRFLLIWLSILPLALYAKLAWASVPAVGFIALLLLGVS
jgi:ion channel-forming bestrophin family protein